MLTLSTTELAALYGLDERRIRKEVEHGVFGRGRRPRFQLAAAVYMRVLEHIGFEVRVVADRRRLYRLIRVAVHERKLIISISPILRLDLKPVLGEVEGRFEHFRRWRDNLVVDDEILGGEPVFPKSRLAVRHVGGMLLRGVSPAEIREDYPYLKNDDLELAKLFALAYPRLGRPRDRQASPR